MEDRLLRKIDESMSTSPVLLLANEQHCELLLQFVVFSMTPFFLSETYHQIKAMASATKPTILLVPGAWHSPACFSTISEKLQAHNYQTVPVTTPSVGTSAPFSADVAAIRAAITSAADAGEDVMLFMHSYGGVPGSNAVEGLRKEDRAKQGKKGGIVRLVYCCAWMLGEGESIIETVGGDPAKVRVRSDHVTEVLKASGTPAEVFYHDLSTGEQEKCVKQLQSHTWEVIYTSKVTYAAFRYVPTVYVYCTGDRTIKFEWQKGLVERAEKEGAQIKTETLKSSHSPFLSVPEEVVHILRKAAGEQF